MKKYIPLLSALWFFAPALATANEPIITSVTVKTHRILFGIVLSDVQSMKDVLGEHKNKLKTVFSANLERKCNFVHYINFGFNPSVYSRQNELVQDISAETQCTITPQNTRGGFRQTYLSMSTLVYEGGRINDALRMFRKNLNVINSALPQYCSYKDSDVTDEVVRNQTAFKIKVSALCTRSPF